MLLDNYILPHTFACLCYNKLLSCWQTRAMRCITD